MKSKALRITIIILTLLVASILWYAASMLVYAADDDYYEDDDEYQVEDEPVLYIGDELITSDNLSGSGWSYDISTRTLTLENYEYSGPGTSPDNNMSKSRAAVRTIGAVTIKLIGDSEIRTSDGSKYNYGIYSKGDINFIGNGTITVRSGKAEGEYSRSEGITVSYDSSRSAWSWKYGEFNVSENAELHVSSGDAADNSTGISTYSSLVVSGNGSLVAEAGKASASVGISSDDISSSDNGYISAKGEDSNRSMGASARFVSAADNSHMIFKALGKNESTGIYLYNFKGFQKMSILGDAVIECYADRRSKIKKPVKTSDDEDIDEDYTVENREQYPEGLVTGFLNCEFSDFSEDCKDPVDEGVCGDDLKWCLTRYGDLVISGTGAMYDYGKDGISIRAPWEMSGDQISMIAVLPGCTKIGDHAFAGYEMPLVSVKMADSVEEIGEGAFDHALNDVTVAGLDLPDGLRKLGKSAFCGCRSIIGEIALPDGLTSVERSAFEGCDSIHSVTMGDGIKTIGDYAFAACRSMKGVNLSDDLEHIGDDAFRECIMLDKVTMPNSLETIGDSSFAECKELSEVLFKGNAPSVGKDFFTGCYGGFVIMYAQGVSGWSTPEWNGYKAYPEHEHDEAGLNIRPASTSSDGRLDHICSVCGTISSRKVIPMIDENSLTIQQDRIYTGGQLRPAVYIDDRTKKRLKKSTDYDIVLSNNINAGTGTVTVNFKGNYTGTLSGEFRILPRDISNKKATLSDVSYIYDGTAKKPAVTITGLTAGTDFDVTYSNNVNAGTATAKVTGKGNYTGSLSLTFKITPASLTSRKITLSASVYSYTGRVRKPAVKVDGVTTANYTVKYSNASSKIVGKYTVTLTGKANYTGSKTLSYKINPKATSIKSLTAGSKCFTAKWTKVSAQATGYQLQYSKSSTFASGNKTVKITSYKTVSKKVTSLTAKKKYYVRIRTYKKVSSATYYSAWSAKKAVTTKS